MKVAKRRPPYHESELVFEEAAVDDEGRVGAGLGA
jgi:hypothetical protein